MKLKCTKNYKLWLPVSNTWAKVHVEFFATVVSVTVQRVGWSFPAVLDFRIKKNMFRDDVMFYDLLLQKFD